MTGTPAWLGVTCPAAVAQSTRNIGRPSFRGRGERTVEAEQVAKLLGVESLSPASFLGLQGHSGQGGWQQTAMRIDGDYGRTYSST